MAFITTVLLKTCLLEDIEPLNDLMSNAGFIWSTVRPFKGVSSATLPKFWYGGSRALECEFYPAAFNYLDVNELKELIQAVNWKGPEYVQLFIREPESLRLEEVPLDLEQEPE